MKLLREPLVHFTLAGALLFGIYSWRENGRGSAADIGDDRVVRITEREVNWIVETSTRQWQRPPTPSEVQGLLREYLREELLAREARALGLDRDDTVVRRRLAQKMTFVLEDTARLAEPADAELQVFYDAHRDDYRTPQRTTFEQIYFSTERRGERAGEDARKTLAMLSGASVPRDPGALGDGSMLPYEMNEADDVEISGQFGPDFAGAVAELEPGAWQGPIASSFGLHLVRLSVRAEGQLRPFADVREKVAEAWRRDREAQAREAYFSGLQRKYDIQLSDGVRGLVGADPGALFGAGAEDAAK